IKLDILLENDINKRHPEHGTAPDSLNPGNSQERGGQRIGNLILNVFRGPSHPFRGYYLLIIPNIRNSIYRNRIAWKYVLMPIKGCRNKPPNDYYDQYHDRNYPIVQKVLNDIIKHDMYDFYLLTWANGSALCKDPFSQKPNLF